MSPLSRRAWWTGIAATALFTTLSCAESDAPFAAGTYIARSDETLIAIIVDDPNGPIVAYACDGRDDRPDPLAEWFNGELVDGMGTISGTEGSSLTLSIAEGTASGELTVKGAAAQDFAGPRASTGVLLWTPPAVNDPDLLGGWIFADDGTQRGAVLKRSIGDTSVTLSSAQTTSLSFQTATLTIKPLSTPTLVQ